MRLTFLGAAGTVTGSCFRVRHDGGAFLVDCGMFQGSRTERELNWRNFPFDPASLDAMLLTHGHIDHCGSAKILAEELEVPIEGPQEADRFWISRLEDDGRTYGIQGRTFESDRWLVDGDTVTVGALTGQNTPDASAPISVTAQGTTSVSCTATDAATNDGAGPGSSGLPVASRRSRRPSNGSIGSNSPSETAPSPLQSSSPSFTWSESVSGFCGSVFVLLFAAGVRLRYLAVTGAAALALQLAEHLLRRCIPHQRQRADERRQAARDGVGVAAGLQRQRAGERTAGPGKHRAPVARPLDAHARRRHNPARRVAPAVQPPPRAQPVQLRAPRRAARRAFGQQPHGGVQLREHADVHLANGFGGKGGEIVQERQDPPRTGEKEENDFLAAAPVVAPGAGGNDDAGVFPAPPAGAGDYVLSGQGSVRGRGGPAVHTLSGLDAVLQLPLQRAARSVSSHVGSRWERRRRRSPPCAPSRSRFAAAARGMLVLLVET